MFSYRDPKRFAALIDKLVDVSAAHLVEQLAAGADAVQIFDTWAGVLPADEFQRWCVDPARRIVEQVRARVANARLIAFPRGAGASLADYVERVPVDAIGIDWTADPTFVRNHIQSRLPVQGNLDPVVLAAGGAALDRAVEGILEAFSGAPFIFNLGHGVLPHTPISHVEQMLMRVRRS